MTSSQTIYLAAVGVYLILFLLFARFFIWKRYADRHYWNRRPPLSLPAVQRLADTKGTRLPFFSVLVPARNEAEVISRTIEHMSALEYDPERFEIIVATDEKELLARDARRVTVVAAAAALLDGRAVPKSRLDDPEEVVLSLLARFAVTDYIAGRREYRRLTLHMTQDLGEPELLGPVARHIVAVESLARTLAYEARPLPLSQLRRVTRLAGPYADQREADLVSAVYLALAVPVAVAFGLVTGHAGSREPARVVGRTGQAREEVTARVLTVMSGVIARSLAERLETERASGSTEDTLMEAYALRFPTTQDMVEERRVAMAAGRAGGPNSAASPHPVIKHVVVPADFDGDFPGKRIGREVPSTKGRALNYALSRTDPRSTVYGFYDAESRPHSKVLLYVAYRRLTEASPPRIFQGPVFQVRNFYRMSPFCKIASLYQAVAHDWYLPALFRRLPFVGGTNLFVERNLLERSGGFDAGSLTEDLELGVRAFLKCRAWPEYLPYPSSEQTPPTLKGFFRQRLRWGSGHLQVMDKVRTEFGAFDRRLVRELLRTLWLKGQFEWVLYQTATLVPPAIIILYATGHVDPTALPAVVRTFLHCISLLYPCFTFYAFFRYSQYIDVLDHPTRGPLRQASVFMQLLLLPLAAFTFPIPYTAALILKYLGREPRSWVKTPRTAE
jgi:cellulose synthase/poly-beta-1,6-N-acetylglucosamine synthase-like glycosyltransferase